MDTEIKQKNRECSKEEGFFSLLNKAINPSVPSIEDVQKSQEREEPREKNSNLNNTKNTKK